MHLTVELKLSSFSYADQVSALGTGSREDGWLRRHLGGTSRLGFAASSEPRQSLVESRDGVLKNLFHLNFVCP